jgi:hypothetical protein
MFFKRAILSSAAAFAAVFAVASAPAHAAGFVNGTFTDTALTPGNFAYNPTAPAFLGWTSTGLSGATTSGSTIFWDNGNDGGNVATDSLGFVQTGGTLSQSVTLLANEKYTLDFTYNSRYSTALPTLAVTVAGLTVATLSNITPVNTAGTFRTPFYSDAINFTELTAGSTSFAFTNTTTGGVDSTVLLDDVVLVDNGPASSVPEPGSMALLGAGLLGMVMVARRRRV